VAVAAGEGLVAAWGSNPASSPIMLAPYITKTDTQTFTTSTTPPEQNKQKHQKAKHETDSFWVN
jgi:hypothetical protein